MASKFIKIGNAGLMKSMNKRVILDMFLTNEAVSRTGLSEASGLAMPTVMRIVDGFIADGLVMEAGKGDSCGGRKPVVLTLNPETYYFLGTDVSRECRSIVADIHGEIIGKAQCIMDYEQDKEGITGQIRQNMRSAIEKSGVDPKKIVYSGIGVPGANFKFLPEHNLFFNFWSDISRAELKERLDIGYPTLLENVGRLGAVAELKFGLGRQLKDFLYIFVDEGVNVGVVINGKLETGYNGIGSEFGHTTINFAGQPCYCGSRGCVEAYCSREALIREYKSNLLDEGLLTRANKQIEFFDLLCAVDGGNKAAEEAVKQAGTALGIGIGNLINLYNPEAIIMGGQISQTLPSYVQAAEEEARRRVFANDARDVKFYETTVQWDSEAIGAVGVACERFFSDYCKK